MRGNRPFASFGGVPAFARPLHTAQLNIPPWDVVEAGFRDVFARRHFTNHGPVLARFERALADHMGVAHVVCVANGTLALMVMARSLGLAGEVIVPAFTFPATVQALLWAGLRPVLCDVDPNSHMVTAELVEPLITEHTSAILGVHLWGRPCAPADLEGLARRHGLRLMFDACHAIGCRSNGRAFGSFGHAEAFSFHATKLVNAAEGGCITTDDSRLAARMRTMRSFSPNQEFADVHPRMNAKMSEAQATLGLHSLREADENIEHNRRRHRAYASGLANLPGLDVLDYAGQDRHNYQYVVLEIDSSACALTRNQLHTLLQAENVLCRCYFHAGMHQLPPLCRDAATLARSYPHTERLTQRLLQLPSGQAVTLDDIGAICELIRDMLAHGDEIRRRLP
jgi:dTDP-4-amino-4,6-dideoxy-D-glucose transaminase